MNETYTAIIWDTLEPFNGEEDITRDIPALLVERSEGEKQELRESPFFAAKYGGNGGQHHRSSKEENQCN